MPLDPALRAELIRLLNTRAVQRGDFTLASGAKSKFYIDGKQVTLSGEGLAVISSLILQAIADDRVDAVGGPTLGADPIAAAVACRSALPAPAGPGRPLEAFIVRKSLKDHGTQRWVEGPLKPGARVVLVEDVVTTGGSAVSAVEKLRELGCTIVRAVVIVDRRAGAEEAFAKLGIPLTSLCRVDELDLPK